MPSSYHGFISQAISLYLKFNPQRVLDIGIGFGKWGMLFREYGDVFRGRAFKDEWKVQIDGVEAFEKYITPVHRHIYDMLYINDVYDIYKELPEYDLIYAGDMIEHLEKDKALELLNHLQTISKVLMIGIPLTDVWPQGEVFGNKFEEHKSIWDESDFNGWAKHIYSNPSGKPIGLFYKINK